VKEGRATVADLMSIPEDERFHEVRSGVLVRKPMPSFERGEALAWLLAMLKLPFDRRAGGAYPGGWWLFSETEVQLDRHEIFRPDLAGWRRERAADRPDDTPVALRPDWVCEVLASGKRRGDVAAKMPVYFRTEVPHFWVIDPVERTLVVHRWHRDGYLAVLRAAPGQRVRAEPFRAVEIQVGVLFGDEPV
jgi:Uma2 family endonuclease